MSNASDYVPPFTPQGVAELVAQLQQQERERAAWAQARRRLLNPTSEPRRERPDYC